jgi:hypothetical protein
VRRRAQGLRTVGARVHARLVEVHDAVAAVLGDEPHKGPWWPVGGEDMPIDLVMGAAARGAAPGGIWVPGALVRVREPVLRTLWRDFSKESRKSARA